ncbi:MAG: hypothetical protein IJ062_05130 [Firmicutes bacterium]|nr:hypothetical protein [Bacillota bacterium]
MPIFRIKKDKNYTCVSNHYLRNAGTTSIDDKVYFCGSDVAKALGYSNAPDALQRHCKFDGIVKHDSVDSKGRKNTLLFISEGNVYRLIAHSKLPAAEKFEKWVFDEVIPSIRKTGMYAAIDYLQSPQFLIDVAGKSGTDKNPRHKQSKKTDK